MERLIRWACLGAQFAAGWFTPVLSAAALRGITRPERRSVGEHPSPPTSARWLVGTLLTVFLGGVLTVPYYGLIAAVGGATFVALAGPLTPPPAAPPATTPADAAEPPADSTAAAPTPSPQMMAAGTLAGVASMLTWAVLAIGGRLLAGWLGTDAKPEYRGFALAVYCRLFIWRGVIMVFVLALSLLPLSALLLAFPAINPQESVLTDAVSERGSWFRRNLRRLPAAVTGLAVLLGLLAVSVEGVSQCQRLGWLPERGSFAPVAKAFMPAPGDLIPLGRTPEDRTKALATFSPQTREAYTTPLYTKLPPAMVEHWQFVILGVYLLDVGVLLLIGKVPLAYNLRNLRVRWLTNAMTAAAFAAVVWLLVFLLAFVNGMNKMTENSGIPGNVFVLSDGSTDEIFSNLGYGDVDNVERATADVEQVMDGGERPVLTDDGQEVWRQIPPLRIRQMSLGGKTKFLAAKETYYSVNQPVPNTDPPRRRFVQLRTHEDADVSAAVHDVQLYPGGRWFSEVGVDQQSRVECVLGEGMAKTLGGDYGKPRLDVGDTFELGEMTWVVTGVMKSEGKTFGSEIWAKRFDRIFKPLGKDKYTTLVMRTDKDTREASRAFANYLSKKYTQQKLKAFSEPDYYAELTKTNNTFLTAILMVCVVMAIGGIFGLMTTMFASIAQRIRDIGVLRLLGFKRWQVMVSFLLESLTLAVVGGGVGVLVAWLTVNGRSATSTLSGGGGGPGGKSITLTIDVDWQVVAMGLLFALVMGRLGGLVPALSAMRMKILDSLR